MPWRSGFDVYSTTILLGTKGFTKAGVRKLIARLHEELALYEGGQEINHVEHP